MITQAPPSTQPPIDAIRIEVGSRFRKSLRELGVLRMYKRDDKLYTFDIPFQLMVPKIGDKIVLVMKKTDFPQRCPAQYLANAKDHIEASLGMSVRIFDEKDVLAVSCQLPKAG